MGYRVWLDIYDINANRVRTVNGVSVDGPARGIRNVSFIPHGGIINQQGTLHFEVPPSLAPNMAIAPGSTIRVRDNVHTENGDVGMYMVTERSRTLSDDFFAVYDCPSLDEELRWQTVPWYAANVATGETVTQTAAAILAIPARYGEPAWTAYVNTALYQFPGVAFQAGGISVLTAAGKLTSERFLGWRTKYNPSGATPAARFRMLELGQFGTTKSGVRLTSASRRPILMTDANVRPIKTFQFTDDAAGVENILVCQGAGNGIAALTLRSLYNAVGETAGPYPGWMVSGPVAFAGYDPRYRLYRRIRADVTNSTDPLQWEYFVADLASVATNRQRWSYFTQSQIAPVSSSPGDGAAAAASLYQAAIAHLQWYSQPNQVIALTADGRGVIRGMAGNTVDVFVYKGQNGVPLLQFRQAVPVISVSRAVNTETETAIDTYLLATQGRPPLTDTALITGLTQAVDYFRMVPMTITGRQDFGDEQYLDSANPITFTINGDASIVERLTSLLTVKLVPIRSTAKAAASATLSFTIPIPALTVTPFTTPAHAHGGISGGSHAHGGATSGPSGLSGTTQGGGVSGSAASTDANNASVSGAFRDHIHEIYMQGGGNPGTGDNSQLLYYNPTGQSRINVVGNPTGPGFARTTGVYNYSVDTTHAHSVSGSAQAQNLAGATAAAQGISGYGGFAGLGTDAGNSAQLVGGQTTNVTTTATGGVHDHPLVYGIYNGPLPTAVTVMVDGTVDVIYQMNSLFDASTTKTVDITPYIQDQQSHTVTISAASAGGVAWFFAGRHRESNVKV